MTSTHTTTAKRAARMTPLFHGSCTTHRQYGLTCDDYTALRRDHNDCCALCGARHPWMNIDHEHALGPAAIRGLLCPRCNPGHMRRIDWGEYPIDERTRDYLINPWYLRRHGLCTVYDPRVSVTVNGLSLADRAELRRVDSEVLTPWSVRKAQPQFEHPGLAACVRAHDVRPVLRLLWMRDRGWLDTDISAPRSKLPQVPTRTQPLGLIGPVGLISGCTSSKENGV